MDFVIGAAAGCSAVVFSNPLEVVKTRLQLQGELKSRGTHALHYRGPLHAARAIARADGVKALQSGLKAALVYQFVMNSTRLGAYQLLDQNGFIRNETGEVNISRSLLAAAAAGGLGAFLASPFNQIKTQMQAMSSSDIAVGRQHRHSTAGEAFMTIARRGGIRELYAGARIGAVRIACGSSVQLTTFSRCKDYIRDEGWFAEQPQVRGFLASCVSGLCVAVVASPLDVILTRLYNQGSNGSGQGMLYSGMLDCAAKIFRTEGPVGFYKGVVPLFFKSAPHIILLMFFWDHYKSLYENYLKSK